MITQSVQDYLKTIYKLQNGRDALETVNTSRLAEKMEVKGSSVTNMIKRLADMRLVQHTPHRGG